MSKTIPTAQELSESAIWLLQEPVDDSQLDKLDEYHDFVKDCLDSFKELIQINKTAFVEVTVGENNEN